MRRARASAGVTSLRHVSELGDDKRGSYYSIESCPRLLLFVDLLYDRQLSLLVQDLLALGEYFYFLYLLMRIEIGQASYEVLTIFVEFTYLTCCVQHNARQRPRCMYTGLLDQMIVLSLNRRLTWKNSEICRINSTEPLHLFQMLRAGTST